MTDEPQPPSEPEPVPGNVPPPAAPSRGGYVAPVGVVPESIEGPFYSTGLTILLTIVTLGIWGAIWTYRTGEDLKKYNGDGLGGVIGVVVYLLISPVLMFTIPNEIKNMYERDGRPSLVGPLWGLWVLLPLIGNIIWYVKVQQSLNEFWASKGGRR